MVKDFFYTNVRQMGNKILLIGYKDGQRKELVMEYEPEFFLPANKSQKHTIESFNGKKLFTKKFSNINEAKKFVLTHKDVEGYEIYGTTNYAAQFISKIFTKDIEYNFNDIRIFFLDIETWSGDGFPKAEEAIKPITLLSLFDSKTKRFKLWGTKPFTETDREKVLREHGIDLNMVDYYEYSIDTEVEMLKDFLVWIKSNHPDIITGWNSREYDIVYIVNRIKNILGEKNIKYLSPWEKVFSKTVQNKRFGAIKEVETYDIVGVADLDYLDLYKKYYPSGEPMYTLDYIAEKHLKKKKVKYKGTLHELYENDYNLYTIYNLVDIDLIVKLEEVLKYISLIVEVSYAGYVPSYMDALGTTRFWETLIYNHLYQKGQVPLIKTAPSSKDEKYDGGFVKEPRKDMHKWIVSFDVTSLYPSIIRTLNIGAETLLDKKESVSVEMLLNRGFDNSNVVANDYSMSANGNLYSKHVKSFFSELMEKLFNKRKYYNGLKKSEKDSIKEKIYDIKQLAYKILINGFYGATGTEYFQFFNLENAKSVTLTGQYIIRSIEKSINVALNNLLKTDNEDYVIGIDTDSCYVNFEKLVNIKFKNGGTDEEIRKFLDAFSEKYIQKVIDESIEDCLKYLNVYQNTISMKREVICNKLLWLGKKHYVMNVLDKEGKIYETPDIVAKGVEIVKSSTPDFCRENLKTALRLILQGTNEELIDFVKTFRKEFYAADPHVIAFPKTVNNIDKYMNTDYKVPIHVKAAKNFNKLVDKYKLNNVYNKFTDSSKIKYVYLKNPNPLFSNVIGFPEELPEEFKLNEHIDYQLMFEKIFINPLKGMTDVIGWDIVRKRKIFDVI